MASMYWGNINDGDYLDYYNQKFMAFAEAIVSNPDGSVDDHKYYATNGIGVYDASSPDHVPCLTNQTGYICHTDPWWAQGNLLHGREYELDQYDTDGTHLLKQTKTQYVSTCPPSGVSGSPPWTGGDGHTYTWKDASSGTVMLVSELDHGNPVAVCDVQTKQVDEYTFDRASPSATVPDKTTKYTYDSYGRTTATTVTSNGGGGATSSPTTVVTATDYVWNDNIAPEEYGVTGTYLIDLTADTFTEDSLNTPNTHYSCSFISYDGHEWGKGGTGTTWLTLGEATTNTQYTGCGNSSTNPPFQQTEPLTTTHTYDVYGNQITTLDPNGNQGCPSGGVNYSSCTAYDSTFAALTASTTNALNQSELTGYATGSAMNADNGFGLWPISTTDLNGQATLYAYDALGRMTSEALPGDSLAAPTMTWTYSDWCGANIQTPCVEIDQTQQLNSSNTTTTRAFYDGNGNLIETREPGPPGYDVVRFRQYDVAGHDIFDSISYLVATYTGGPGSGAFSVPAQVAGTSTAYDGLDRATSMTDAQSQADTTTTSYQVECGGNGDSACYAETVVVDPLGHQTSTYTDALGREIYSQTYTGNSTGTYAVYTTSSYRYDDNGNLVTINDPNTTSIQTTYTYDAAGRMIGMTDPDRGTETYQYDANGNRIESVDARGASGTVWTGYDKLNRQIWRNTTDSPTGAYVQYSYDVNYDPPACPPPPGICGTPPKYNGHLTKETFTGGPNNTLSGSYIYDYDPRGEQTKQTETVGSSSYTLATTYDDASNVTSQTYPDGEVVTKGYSANGWLEQVQTQQSGTTTTLLSNATYSGVGGANHLITSATLGTNSYTYTATYDNLVRLTNEQYTLISSGANLFAEYRLFDKAGNLSTLDTTLPQGVDQQYFCYDEQNRLTWAGTNGLQPCTAQQITPPGNEITSAEYTHSYSYDIYGRLTGGTLGAYTYGAGMQSSTPAPLHAVSYIGQPVVGGGSPPPIPTGTSSTSRTGSMGHVHQGIGPPCIGLCAAPPYSASYDAAGEMTCRSTNTTPSLSCFGGNTGGAQLSYDNEQRLIGWQNAPTSPTTTDAFLYDGEGNRVEQQVTQSGVTTTTAYVGNLEEIATSGNTTTTTTYYYAGSMRVALSVNGTISYLGSDALGSSTVALSASGTETAAQLYDPYGNGRYSSGAMPTDYAYTGQHADSATGLDYYNARYYDPLASQFISADSVLPGKGYDVWGLSRYAYVEGNPETRSDPTGHCFPLCLPLPVITAIAGAVVGAAVATVSIVSAAQSGTFGWGTVAQAGADIALGAGAGLALGVNPVGAGLGAFGSALGVGLGVKTGGKFNLQSAFENVAVGAIAGAVGGGVGANIAKNVASTGARMILQTAVQGAIGGVADLGAQAINQMGAVINGRQSWQFDLGETGIAFGFSALGGFVAQRMLEGAGIGGAKYAAGTSKVDRAVANWLGGAVQGVGDLMGDGYGGRRH